jgi:glycerophosphoryl diester phosphodiesterase
MITNIAHRGARLLAPENTLEAAQSAKIHGAHMWELDVQVSSDNKLIIIHDDTLERTTNVHLLDEFKSRAPWYVCNFSSEELRKLDFGYAFNNVPSNNSFKHHDAPFLDSAISLSKKIGIEMNIEIKDISNFSGHETIAKKVYHTVKMKKYLPHVLFSSFNMDYLFQIRKIDAEARIAVLMDHPDDNFLHLLDKLKAEAYHPHYSIADQPMIDQLHQRQIQVNIWTVNDKKSMLQFIKKGVDGIITDDPVLLNLINKSQIG